MGQSQFPDRTGKKVHYIDVFARPTWANEYAAHVWNGQPEWTDEEMRKVSYFLADSLDVPSNPQIRVFMFHKVKHFTRAKEENKV